MLTRLTDPEGRRWAVLDDDDDAGDGAGEEVVEAPEGAGDDPFDLESYPEELRPRIEAARAAYEELEQKVQQAEPFLTAGESAQKALALWEALHNEQTHDLQVEHLGRQYGLIPEGYSLEQWRRITGGQQAPAEEEAGDPEDLMTRAEMDAYWERKEAEREQRQTAAQREADVVNAGVEALQGQEDELLASLKEDGVELDQRALNILRGQVRDRMASGVITERNFDTALEDTWKELSGWGAQYAKDLVTRQRSGPRTTTPGGRPAGGGGTKKVTDFASMRAALRAEIGAED